MYVQATVFSSLNLSLVVFSTVYSSECYTISSPSASRCLSQSSSTGITFIRVIVKHLQGLFVLSLNVNLFCLLGDVDGLLNHNHISST